MSPPVCVDSSALLALLNAADEFHSRAATWWREERRSTRLVVTAPVLYECCALVRARLGADAARDLVDRLGPAMELVSVGETESLRALSAFSASQPSAVSLVDRSTFEVMRGAGISIAFTFDRHFEQEGFVTVPA